MSTMLWPPAGLALLQQKWAEENGIQLPKTQLPRRKERRRDKRICVPPVIILSNSLSDLPILPEDLSLGGFCAVFTHHIQPETRYQVRVILSDEIVEAGQAQAVWTKTNNTVPSTWTVGFRLSSPAAAKKQLRRFLKTLGAA